MHDAAEVVGGVRHGPFIVFTDLDGNRHAVRFSSVAAISDLDQAQDATLLQLLGGRAVVVLKPFSEVLGWFMDTAPTPPPGRMTMEAAHTALSLANVLQIVSRLVQLLLDEGVVPAPKVEAVRDHCLEAAGRLPREAGPLRQACGAAAARDVQELFEAALPGGPGGGRDLQSIDLKANGRSNGRSRRYQPQSFSHPDQVPRFLRPSDRAILRRLGPGAEQGDDFIATLQAIIATGRGRWAEGDGPVLVLGDPVPATITWIVGDDGRQRPELQLPPGLVPLHLAATWYADPSTGAMGPIQSALPDRVLRTMLSSPALPPDTAARVRDEMGRRWPQHCLPAPEPVEPPEPVNDPLQPVLSLLRGELPFDPARAAYDRNGRFSPSPVHDVPLARLSWRYGPVTLQPGETRELIMHDGRLLRPVRDMNGEAQAGERLHSLGFGRISHYGSLPPSHPHATDLMLMDPDPGAWIEFMLDDLPDLQAEGWAVEVAADFPLRLASPTGDLSVEIREGSGIDWFDIDLGIMVDGTRVNLAPALLNLIADAGLPIEPAEDDSDDAAPPLLLPLADGRLLAIPFARLRPILAPLLELFAGADLDLDADAIRLSRRNAADLAALEQASSGAGIAWSGGKAVRALGRQLREHQGLPPCPAPTGFGAMLRPYQAHGLAWLQFLRAADLGGVLADDMGLGKTVQALAHLAVEQEGQN